MVFGSTTIFVGWPKLSMSRLLGSLIGRPPPPPGGACAFLPDLHDELAVHRVFQNLGITSTASAQPHVVLVVDVDAVLLVHPRIVRPGPQCRSRLPF